MLTQIIPIFEQQYLQNKKSLVKTANNKYILEFVTNIGLYLFKILTV